MPIQRPQTTQPGPPQLPTAQPPTPQRIAVQPPPNPAAPGLRPPAFLASHIHQPLHRPPPGQPTAIPHQGFAQPGQRPLPVFGQPQHVNPMHSTPIIHGHAAATLSGPGSPPAPASLSNVPKPLDQRDTAPTLPPTGLFGDPNFPALHWGAGDATSSLPEVAPGLIGAGISKVPIGSGARTETLVGGVAPIGSNKAVTRPAPIRRPSAVTPPATEQSTKRDDDEPVAGSASLGGEVLKDDERIGGSTWRRKSSAPALSPLGIGLDSFAAGAVGGPSNGTRLFEGFGPFGSSWDAPSPLGAALGGELGMFSA